MFDGILQPTHLLLILAVVLIIFGPGKLPEAGKAMGKMVREFRRATSGALDEVGTEELKATGTPEIKEVGK